ncbi:unnamed protein product [Phytophthora fragariaefolia]|uniref:Unnamed protein product n=1 Tax=Phytophthora fragariaefolia TaxID=1490495 RepID=A0A9W6XPD5_9STRA|nr:unnamed protein product [Phytophthora fragariaefolia]
MEPGTRFAVHLDRFKEPVLQMETIGEALDETWKLMLRLDNLAAEYRIITTSGFAFTATGAMEKSEWLEDSGASSHMTNVRDKFVSMKELKMPVRVTIADDTKIDAVATGNVGLKLMDGTTATLYIPKIDGTLILVSKLAEKNVVAHFSKESVSFAIAMQPSRSRNAVEMSTS